MTTITAADAAARAGRTVDTIRHWCRMGAVRATKVAGRWAIDVASLDYRISLDTQEPTMPTLECEHTTDPDNPCRDCQRKFRPIMFKRYVAALTEGLELPPLTGTPKQIAWAEQLRARSLAGNWEDVERGLTDEGRGNGLCDVIEDTRPHGKMHFQMRSGRGQVVVTGNPKRTSRTPDGRNDHTSGTWASLTHWPDQSR